MTTNLPQNKKVLQYVPQHLRPHVVGCTHDSDGYWIWFDDQIVNPLYESATVSEDTVAALKATLKEIKVKEQP